MAYVILGLLLIRPRSLYDLVRAFEAGPALFYSASSGSIKRAIDGLLRDGRIEVDHIDPAARGRKTYRITPVGTTEFRTWMRSDISGSNAEPAILARLFFLGFCRPSNAKKCLTILKMRCNEAAIIWLTSSNRWRKQRFQSILQMWRPTSGPRLRMA